MARMDSLPNSRASPLSGLSVSTHFALGQRILNPAVAAVFLVSSIQVWSHGETRTGLLTAVVATLFSWVSWSVQRPYLKTESGRLAIRHPVLGVHTLEVDEVREVRREKGQIQLLDHKSKKVATIRGYLMTQEGWESLTRSLEATTIPAEVPPGDEDRL